MTQQNNEAFEKWFESELQKLIDVKNYDDMHMLQINKHLAWKAWQAATQHSEREIAELNAELGKLTAKYGIEWAKFQASNNKLREALNTMRDIFDVGGNITISENNALHKADKALASTPAQSLSEFENEVIERCAKACLKNGCPSAAYLIRALKGTS